MRTMNEQVRKEINGVFKANADKQNSLSKVCATTVSAILANKSLSVEAMMYASALRGEKHFILRVIDKMSHVTYNGTSKKVACDFVHVKKDEIGKYNKAIREYRIAVGEEAVELTQCVGHLERTEQVNDTIVFEHESGYKQEIAKRDAEGKVITHDEQVYLIPREKTVWGYTDTVRDAIIAALEELVNE